MTGCLTAAMASDLSALMRKHSVKVCTAAPCSVEQCAAAVAQVVGHRHVVSAARMNSAVVIFINCLAKVNAVVEAGVMIQDSLVPVIPLTLPATKVVLSNIPPFISDEFLRKELSRHGKIVSPIKEVLSGCKSPLLPHVVSHRRQLYMILTHKNQELDIVFKVKVEDSEYMLFATTKTMKCFGCGREGHLARVCPERKEDAGERARNGGTPGQVGRQVDRQVGKKGVR